MNKRNYETGSYRQQVRLPDDWKEAIEQRAAAAGVSVSEYIRDVIYQSLPKRTQKSLSEVKRGRPTAPAEG